MTKKEEKLLLKRLARHRCELCGAAPANRVEKGLRLCGKRHDEKRR